MSSETDTATQDSALPLVPASNPKAALLRAYEGLSLREITALPERLDDGMIASLKEVISAPVPEQVPCPSDYLNKALVAMMAVLPRQGKDAVTGALLFDQYARKLGKHPKGAIDYLWSTSIDRLKWFPTIAECNEIAGEWVSRAQELKHAKSIAESKIAREKDLRFRDAIDLLRTRRATQADVDAYPEKWRAYAAEQGFLWRLKDGTYLIRPDTLDMTPEQLEAHRARVANLREEGLL